MAGDHPPDGSRRRIHRIDRHHDARHKVVQHHCCQAHDDYRFDIPRHCDHEHLGLGRSAGGDEHPAGRHLGRLVMSAFSSNATWYLMRSSGGVALVLLTAVVVLGIATNRRWRPARTPRVVTAGVHRTISLLTVAFLGVHVLTAVVDPYAVVGAAAVIVPFIAGRNAFWVGLGALSLDLIAALIVSSLLRARVAPTLWRGIHWLAYLAWPLALAHSFGTGTDASSRWLEATGAICTAAVVGSVFWRITAKRGAKHLEPRPVTA